MKKIIIAAVIGIAAFGVSQADAAQRFTVRQDTGSFDAPIECPATWVIKKIPPKGIRDCNRAEGKIIVWNNTPGYVNATVDTTLSYPEYE